MNRGNRFSRSISITVGRSIGPEHVREGSPNQDAFGYFHSDRLIAVAVADGLGSAAHSDEGSEAAVQIAIRRIVDFLSCREPRPEFSAQLRSAIVDEWRSRFEGRCREYATTLLFFGCKPSCYLIGKIGDGMLSVRYRRPSKEPLSFNDTERAFLTETYSLVSDSIEAKFLIEVVNCRPEVDLESVALASDGVSDDLNDPNRYVSDVLARLHERKRTARNAFVDNHLAEWPTEAHYDDKTLLLLTFGPAANVLVDDELDMLAEERVDSSVDAQPSIEPSEQESAVRSQREDE